MRWIALLFLFVGFVRAVFGVTPAVDALWNGFLDPPDEAKPWCYYWWINGHVDERTITDDLEAMRARGFGGILLFDSRGYWDADDDHVVNPKAELAWGSSRWYDLVEHTLRECARLRLTFAMNASASGGEMNGFTNGVKYVTDISDARAVAAHLNRVVGPLLKRCPGLVGKTFTHIYSVSYEGDIRKGVTWKTIRDSFYGVMAGWARDHGLSVFSESGGPWAWGAGSTKLDCDQLDMLAHNDFPQGEFWPIGENGFSPQARHANANGRFFIRGPVLAARREGRPIISAEAFTHMQRHWSVDPAFLKPLADQAFADGVNRIVWHTFTASPAEFGVPGAEYFAGSHINRNVTWHREAGPFVRYIARCSYLLQQGAYVDDGEFANVSTNYHGWGRFRKDPHARFTTIHRRSGGVDLFFVVGEGRGSFDFPARGPAEIWDAVTGARRLATGVSVVGDRTRIALDLPVGGSCFVLFGVSGAGRIARPACRVTPLAGPWRISFAYHPGIVAAPPAPVEWADLVDFTAREDLKYFAGTAIYRASFRVAADVRAEGAELELGKVPSGLVHARINGVDCGTIWCEPWRCDISRALRPGTNALELAYIGNWHNRLIGDCALSAEERVTRSTIHYWREPRTGNLANIWSLRPTVWSGYSASDPLQPAGILGPVKIRLTE